MQLYLVQHGQAVSGEVNPERPLNEEGRAAVERSAELASRLGVEVAEIRHSNKLRAIQTAEVLGRALQAPYREMAGLGPKDDVSVLAQELASSTENLMIVGHLPFLARLASLLLCQLESATAVEFRNAGIVRLDRREEGGWSLRWAIPPNVLANMY
jgi:phosphohistidine phosphatase